MNIPVLFLVFKRPETTKRVFQAIRAAKPPRLYVAADGPRPGYEGEAEKCEKARKTATDVDWPCDVKVLFRDENLGCGPAVKSAIDWFFENEEMGIILEDDVLPKPSFFPFCEELLHRYKTDTRIGMISGNNHAGYIPYNDSYFFSKYKMIWGWATWKRSWDVMDFEMSWLQSPCANMIIKNMGHGKASEKHWLRIIDLLQKMRVNSWAYRWFFSLAAQNLLCIFPRYNLAANIGYGAESTHTPGKAPRAYVDAQDIEFPLHHPQFVIANTDHDRLLEKKILVPPIQRFFYGPLRSIVPEPVREFVKQKLTK